MYIYILTQAGAGGVNKKISILVTTAVPPLPAASKTILAKQSVALHLKLLARSMMSLVSSLDFREAAGRSICSLFGEGDAFAAFSPSASWLIVCPKPAWHLRPPAPWACLI